MSKPWAKKILTIAAIITIASFSLFAAAPVFAQSAGAGGGEPPPPPQSTTGFGILTPEEANCSSSFLATILTFKAGCFVYRILYIIVQVLVIVLNLVSALFDYVISYLNLNLTSEESVFSAFIRAGWGTVQSVANMFFILILLWIALATILDLPNYTAKKLLPTLIVMALLVNFSLVFVFLVIDISNGLMYFFHASLHRSSSGRLGDKIIDITRAQNMVTKPPPRPGLGEESVLSYRLKLNKAQKNLRDCVATSENPIGGCRQEQEEYNKISAILASKSDPGKIEDTFTKAMIVLIMMIPFLLVLIWVLLIATVFFIVRPVTLALLSIFGPIVFVMNILPDTKKYWGEWWGKINEQAFFGPAFMFLLYVSINSLGQSLKNLSEGAIRDPNNPINNVKVVVTFLLFMIVLIADLILARKIGGKWGAMAEGYTRKGMDKLKGAALTGGARLAAPAADKFLGTDAAAALSRIPVLRQIPKAAAAIRSREKERAERRAKLYAELSPEAMAGQFGKFSETEQAALAASMSADKRQKMVEEMLKNNAFQNLSAGTQRGLMSGIKTFIPEAEMAMRHPELRMPTREEYMRLNPLYRQAVESGTETPQQIKDYEDWMERQKERYQAAMDALMIEKSQMLGNIRPESLENEFVQRSLKRVGTGKDFERLASTKKGVDMLNKILEEDFKAFDQAAETNFGEFLRNKYGNTEVEKYAFGPLVQKIRSGQVVRPKGKKRGGG